MSNRILKKDLSIGKGDNRRYRWLRWIMALMILGQLVLTHKNCIQVTEIVLSFVGETPFEKRSFSQSIHCLPLTSYLLACAGLCLFRCWAARILRIFLLLGNAVFWIVLIKILMPMVMPLSALAGMTYSYTWTGYVCVAISLILVACGMVSLRERSAVLR